MPNSAPCLHPFHATRAQRAELSGRVAVHQGALQQCRVRRDTRVRMHRSTVALEVPELEVVEKDERLYEAAEIARAQQPRQRALRMPSGSVGNAPPPRWRSVKLWFGHDERSPSVGSRRVIGWFHWYD